MLRWAVALYSTHHLFLTSGDGRQVTPSPTEPSPMPCFLQRRRNGAISHQYGATALLQSPRRRARTAGRNAPRDAGRRLPDIPDEAAGPNGPSAVSGKVLRVLVERGLDEVEGDDGIFTDGTIQNNDAVAVTVEAGEPHARTVRSAIALTDGG